HSPTTYKIPAITDVPEVFNVATFDNNDNVRNVYRSKAVGEPPLMFGIAVWAAARNALTYVSPISAEALRLPATGEEMLRCLTLGSTKPQQSAGAAQIAGATAIR